MNRTTAIRAGIALLIFVIGSVQAWDSNVGELQGVAGLFIVFLVSIAIGGAFRGVALAAQAKAVHRGVRVVLHAARPRSLGLADTPAGSFLGHPPCGRGVPLHGFVLCPEIARAGVSSSRRCIVRSRLVDALRPDNRVINGFEQGWGVVPVKGVTGATRQQLVRERTSVANPLPEAELALPRLLR